MRIVRFFSLLPTALLFASCAGGGGLGTLGDILGSVGGLPGAGGQQSAGEIRAEVDQVDTQRQRIHVRTESGQRGSVVFDQQTEVIYQQQRYPVTALERGDVVRIQGQQTSGNEIYAQRILVEQSVQERSGGTVGGVGGSSQVRQLEGRVGRIDTQQGTFELQTQYSVLTVALPYNSSSATQDRFRRLRTGETVRLEGELLSDGRVQLYRFY